MGCLRRLLTQAALLLLLASGLALFAAMRSYRAFSHEELVAVVRCEADRGRRAKFLPGRPSGEFVIELAPVVGGVPEPPQRYPMTGDQWAIGGDFLRWKPWVAFLGLPSRHRLTRLNSRYWKADAERTRPRSVYDLEGGTSPLWRWLYRAGARLPCVDSVYGSAAYVPARPGGRWGVYVTHSGYLIRPLSER